MILVETRINHLEVSKMNGIKFLMALAAVFILIVPAFSMPYNGMGQDDKQKICDCQKPMMGQDDKQKYACFGQDGKQKTCKSMMPCMGKDDKQKTCDCQKSMMGDGNKQAWQGKDDKQKSCDCEKPCDCQKSMKGQDDRQKSCNGEDGMHVKSMMAQKYNQMTHKQIKSMMGDRKEDRNGGVKIVIINLKV